MFEEVQSPSLGVTRPLDILAVAAHPDDIEQTCGGMLIRRCVAPVRVFLPAKERGADETSVRGWRRDDHLNLVGELVRERFLD